MEAARRAVLENPGVMENGGAPLSRPAQPQRTWVLRIFRYFWPSRDHSGTIVEPQADRGHGPKAPPASSGAAQARHEARHGLDDASTLGMRCLASRRAGASHAVAQLSASWPALLFWVEKGQENNARWQRGQDLGYSAYADDQFK